MSHQDKRILSEAVTFDPHTNINMMPLFAKNIAGYGNLKDEEVKSAFDQTSRFDLVIVLGTIHDPVGIFFAALVDQVVLIVKEGATRKRDVDRALKVLGSDARKIKGTVLTHART